jgi:hypothetical protein
VRAFYRRSPSLGVASRDFSEVFREPRSPVRRSQDGMNAPGGIEQNDAGVTDEIVIAVAARTGSPAGTASASRRTMRCTPPSPGNFSQGCRE